MTLLTEGDLQVSFPDASNGRKFDAPGREHGLSHCMKAVDFIVEFDNKYLFIEFKDPQQPGATEERRKKFIETFKRGNLDNDLKYKCRDSFLYEWASGRANKPIYYFVLIALDSLQSRDLAARTDAMQRELPINGPGGTPWNRPFVSQCIVFNIESWNRRFPSYQIKRLSDGSVSESTGE